MAKRKGLIPYILQPITEFISGQNRLWKKEEDAQDLTQIVFTEAYKNIHTLQAIEALYGWLDGITYHQGMKIYRKQKDVLLTEEASAE